MPRNIIPKVLIVDDLEDNRFVSRKVLEKSGDFEFYEASDGAEGVALARRHLPHIILMDAVMPGMDGFEAIGLLRKNPETRDIPILMVSALDTQNDRVKALRSGISDFIAKPFDATELTIRVNSLLKLYLDYLHKETELNELNQELEEKVRKRTYALIRRERYTRTILDSTPTLTCVFDETGQMLDANRVWLSFFGLSKEHQTFYDSFGMLHDQIPSMQDPSFLNAYPKHQWLTLLLNSHRNDWRIAIFKEDRRYVFKANAVTFQTGTAPETDADAQANMLIVTLNDISEIEHIREERESQIKLASIGKLAAGITHEINTPLTYIKGNLELMRMDIADIGDQALQREMLDYMDTIGEGVRRIGNIVDATREVTKKGSEEKEPTNLYSTLVMAARMVYNRTKHISDIAINGHVFNLDMQADAELCENRVIKEKIEQVWIILLNNTADEFLKSDLPFEERRIDIRIGRRGDSYEIVFTDNAGGIPEHILPHMFEPFATTKTHSGMGLGLNIAQKIVNEHGGTITAHNEQEGAVFTVLLPVVDV